MQGKQLKRFRIMQIKTCHLIQLIECNLKQCKQQIIIQKINGCRSLAIISNCHQQGLTKTTENDFIFNEFEQMHNKVLEDGNQWLRFDVQARTGNEINFKG